MGGKKKVGKGGRERKILKGREAKQEKHGETAKTEFWFRKMGWLKDKVAKGGDTREDEKGHFAHCRAIKGNKCI